LFENHSENSIKPDLSNDTTVNPSLFSSSFIKPHAVRHHQRSWAKKHFYDIIFYINKITKGYDHEDTSLSGRTEKQHRGLVAAAVAASAASAAAGQAARAAA
jgi:hypothetical protein